MASMHEGAVTLTLSWSDWSLGHIQIGCFYIFGVMETPLVGRVPLFLQVGVHAF